MVICVILLALVSIATIFSTTYLQYDSGSYSATIMQIAWFAVGAVAAAVVMQLDRETLYHFAPAAYGLGLILLVLVLIFYDRELAVSNGAHSWITIGPLSLQPSELMKVAYIIMMAYLVQGYNDEGRRVGVEDMSIVERVKFDGRFLLKLTLWTMPPVALIIAQNDLGTTLVFLMMFIGIIFVSGITWYIILPAFIFFAVIALVLIILVVYQRDLLYYLGFQDYQFARIDSWLNPFGNSANESYQLAQSLKAIGSGGILGKGLGQFQVHVPVRESDMIFSTIGENFGFIGASFVVLLYFILIFQMISVAFRAHDAFYASMVSGVVMMFAFHIVENIGMSIGLLPLTGIPLPLISAGGTALITSMISIGLILSIKYNEGLEESQLTKNPVVRAIRWINRLIPRQILDKLT
ncbi:rod shape-determining protein RodA [Aerococcus viridans]|uniref:Rod shape-determining protein RodA n=1 Tax=Aerococcus viridans TaxID=1377 RepID=A0A2N6UBG6_9LACT|nr:rod shape-determining protein RodA [Aerococcus viridans]